MIEDFYKKYSKPVYEDLWRRDMHFVDYNCNDEFFIQLDYRIHRDAFRGRIGHGLDLGIKAGNGSCIFRPSLRDEFAAKGYRIIKPEDIDEKIYSSQDLYKVTETYGYAPKNADGSPKIFHENDTDFGTEFGVVDTDGELTTSLSLGGHSIEIETFKFYLGAAVSQFRIGDRVTLKGIGISGSSVSYSNISCPYTTVQKIEGEYLHLSKFTGTLVSSGNSVSAETLIYWLNTSFSGWWEPPWLGTFELYREYIKTETGTDLFPMRLDVTWHDEYPAIVPRTKVLDALGFETDTITNTTNPNTLKYKGFISNGVFYIPKANEIKADGILYKRIVHYTQWR